MQFEYKCKNHTKFFIILSINPSTHSSPSYSLHSNDSPVPARDSAAHSQSLYSPSRLHQVSPDYGGTPVFPAVWWPHPQPHTASNPCSSPPPKPFHAWREGVLWGHPPWPIFPLRRLSSLLAICSRTDTISDPGIVMRDCCLGNW